MGGELGEQTRLADPGLTHHGERRGPPLIEHVESLVENAELLHAANEVFGEHNHHPPPSEARSVPGSKDQGVAPMSAPPSAAQAGLVPRYLLHHRHEADECGVVYAAFKGHDSPLRRQATVTSCCSGGHEIWWTVNATSDRAALALLPFFVAERTTAAKVTDVHIP
jgi:hypothetical protein